MLALYLLAISAPLARGDAVFIEADVTPKGAVEAVVANARSPKELKLAPYVELSGNKMIYALRASPDAALGTHRLFAIIELKGPGGALLGTAQIDQAIEIVAPVSSKEAIDAARKLYLAHQSEASSAYDLLPRLHDLLRLDRADPPPAFAKVKDAELEALKKFFHHRLRADIELRKLRTAVDSADPALAEAGLLAIGALSQRPTGTVTKASAIEGETIGRSLELAAAALEDARIDEGEAYLNKLTFSGRLDKSELARALVLLGAVYAARGRPADASKSMGRAFCIEPKLEVALGRPLYKKTFDAARSAPNVCKTPITIGAVTASRVEGTTILIRAVFSDDPHGLISGGDVEVWGSGGGVHRAEKVRAAGNTLEATIEDTGELQAYDGQLLLRVLLREVSGVAIATFGDPDPTPVPLDNAGGGFSLDIPWWGWVTAASVVVIGAATAAIVIGSDREVVYGIGPISAQF